MKLTVSLKLFVATLGVSGHAFAQDVENVTSATLRDLQRPGAPILVEQFFRFEQDDWIHCRSDVREMGLDCWRLTPPQSLEDIAFLEPEKAEFLIDLTEQIGPGGASRTQVEALLDEAGITTEALDQALEVSEVGWSFPWDLGPNWGNILQVRLGESHVLYVAFRAEHEGQANVAAEGALVPDPGHFSPGAVASPDAVAYREAGEFARCGQQALLDAGFDPNGVDGAPGAGARRALTLWSEASDIPAPEFTGETASQVCFLLTAVTPRMNGTQTSIESDIIWPIWSGNVFYNENKAAIQVLADSDGINQTLLVDFGDGLRFGNQSNSALTLPWSPSGSVALHGADEVDGIDGGEYSAFASEMLGLIQAQTPENGKGVTEQMFNYIGFPPRLLQRALGADRSVDRDAVWQVLWTVVDQVDDMPIVAADTLLDQGTGRIRVVLFMKFDPDGEDSELLYGLRVRVSEEFLSDL